MYLHRSNTTRMTKFSDPTWRKQLHSTRPRDLSKDARTRQESMFPASPQPLPTMANRIRHLLLRLAIGVDWRVTCQRRFSWCKLL